MTRHVAFLRAVNVGGNRKTPSKDLCTCLEAIGLEEVATFRASGNVVFSAGVRESEAALVGRLEKALKATFGFEVPVFLRSEKEVRAIAAYEPFDPKLVAASKGKLQVSLLLKKPPAVAAKQALELATDDDLLALRGRELYWLPSGGYSDSALDRQAVDKLLGESTHRTMGTIQNIAEKYLGD